MDQGDRARHGSWMDETLIGYARCSTDEQDLTAQRQALHTLGVPPDRVYIDHGISGTKRERPGLDQALAAVRTGDTLVVPKLDRLARSVPDARDIGDTLAKRGVSLSLGVQIYADHEALIRIDDGGTIRGDLPRTAARLVEQWRALHQDELLANWLLAQEPAALSGIEPLQ